jgi:hypothetical protein
MIHPPDTLKLGLRFARSETRKLRDIATRARSEGLAIDMGLFEQAADSAETGEPLIVICDEPEDGARMADGFILWGIERPAVEELTS